VWDIEARKRARVRRRIRIGLAFVVCLAVVQLAIVTVIPRPAIGNTGGWQWGLWVWLGQGYGVQREYLNSETLVVHRWGERVSRIESEERWATGTPAKRWSLARTGPDGWRLEVMNPTVRWQSVLLAFNTMRTDDELFGVRIIDALREESGGSFEIEGTRAQVLAEMIRVYGLTIEPGLTSETDTDVWVILPETGELAEVSVARAEELGMVVVPFQADAVRRIEVVPGMGIVEGAADMLRAWREDHGTAGPGHR